MLYLYHSVPKHLQGTSLYPLNVLKEKLPDVYEKEVGKYAGREHVMQYRIPQLDCLWNDVLHFTAVHPRDIKAALFETGRQEPWTQSCYQIDPHALDTAKAVVYLYPQSGKESQISEKDFVPFDPDALLDYSVLPQETRDYYAAMHAKGKKPLLYLRVPHILYKGEIDIVGVPILSV